jgi:hypothetical protein
LSSIAPVIFHTVVKNEIPIHISAECGGAF